MDTHQQPTRASGAQAQPAAGAAALPTPPTPTGLYSPAVTRGDVVEISGQIGFVGGELETGRVGAEIDTERAQALAETCTRNALAIALQHLGSLDQVAVQRVRVFVACTPEYAEQHIVADGASSLLLKTLGEAGAHARTAIGVQSLPFGAPVEVELALRVQ